METTEINKPGRSAITAIAATTEFNSTHDVTVIGDGIKTIAELVNIELQAMKDDAKRVMATKKLNNTKVMTVRIMVFTEMESADLS